jgi:hypothetical protein
VTDARLNAAITPMAFLIDCDNTLLRNDAVKEAMNQRLIGLDGQSLADDFWKIYEEVRSREGTVDLPSTFSEFRPLLSSDSQLEAVRSAIMDFPFPEYLYPDALDTIATLKRYGLPVIVSDGDNVYQPHKIVSSGLADAVDDQWVVYVHKEQHLGEITRRWPTSLYVMIDDKARLLAAMKSLAPDRFVTVHILQGHYSSEAASPAPDIILPEIGDVRRLDFASLRTFAHV